ncbi:hypothetical protein [Winogradskyella sp. SYSU M77433]|uniref:hypothetical protein n=1 Tax=Winogradskyella sp. SYSU M77433 TaxID=3042722 RepID=UPI0024804052|nr:hypothetical protein [Winogradskyella sp. SYSU M77433]MDH7913760.1 hypothetical protein [Winogradskyella sp. SYSU M77433]
MSTKIKNTLFRFVSMRAPELVDEESKQEGFIFRSDSVEKGVFDTAVSDLSEGTTKWQAMKTASETFQALTKEQLKALKPELYKFSVWVAKNRLSYSQEALESQIEGLTPISDQKVLGELWNNLFYQILTQKEFYAKEILIQLLIANNFLTNYKGDKSTVKGLLNSKVVLPKTLFIEEGITEGAQAKVAQSQTAPPSLYMMQQHAVSEAKLFNEQLTQLKKELKKAEKVYSKEYQAALETAEENYQKEIKPILDQYNADLEAERQKWCEIRDPNQTYDPNDPCKQPNVIPEPDVPKFTFQFRDELDYDFIQTKLSTESFETLSFLVGTVDSSAKSGEQLRISEQEFNSFSEDLEGFTDLDNVIQDVISDNENTIVDNTQDEGNTFVSIGGVVVPVDNTDTSPDFSYELCFTPKTVLSIGGYYFANLGLKVPDPSWQISGIDYTLHRSDGDYTDDTILHFSSNNGLRHYIKMNIGNPTLADQPQIQSFSATITFTNGVVKTLNESVVVLGSCTNGIASGEFIDDTNDDIPNSGTSNEQPFIPSGFGIKQLGVADYNKVEQTTQGYVEGDVAHIENIMAREFKERSTRRLRRKEDTVTTSSETEREQLTDTTSVNRFEMQNEVAKVIQEANDFSAGTSFNASYGTGKNGIQLGANANYATHNSSEQSTVQAVTEAKEITERALDRIVTKVKEERIEKIVEEFEENNSHGFDNRKGDKHVVGVFRWVDKVFKNQIINYGKRLMFEFMVPQPGKLHKLGMIGAQNTDDSLLVEPVDPRKSTTQQVKDFSELTDTKLKYWAAKYNVDFNSKPQSRISISQGFEGNYNSTGYFTTGKGEIEIPEGYEANKAKASVSFDFHPGGMEASGVTINVGDKFYNKQWFRHFNTQNISFNNLGGIQKKLGVAYKAFDCGTMSLSVVAECDLTTEALNQWKQETFKAIIDAYDEALITYNEKLAEEKVLGVEIKGTNPGFYREFENKILRKNCISYLLDQNPSAKNTYGKSNLFYTNNGGEANFGNIEVNVNQALDSYAAFVKFMEQAFEWEIMSYNLYPYYWGNRQDWSNLYQYDESNDPLFRNFMQAGMARVVVTVRPGFEEAVRYYMQTGQIWNGGEVPVIEDELYLSLIDELRKPEGEKLGKAWPTRVPTALTILQAQSIGLNVTKALPFNEDLSDFENPEEVPQSAEIEMTDAQIGISEGDGERHIENVDIVDGYLQFNTDDDPRQTVAQISIQSIKNAIDGLA